MTKLKVRVESPPERCEICHKSDLFNRDNNYCSRCDGITAIVVKDRQRPRIYSSPEIEVAEEGDSLVLTKGGFSWRKTGRILGNLILGNFPWLIFIYIGVPMDWYLYYLIFYGLYYAYSSLAEIMNRDVIRVTRREIRVNQKPIPWLERRKIDAEEIEQIFCETNENWNGKVVGYQVSVKMKDGKRKRLISGITTEEAAIFLEQQIESRLGIKDSPVHGELPR